MGFEYIKSQIKKVLVSSEIIFSLLIIKLLESY